MKKPDNPLKKQDSLIFTLIEEKIKDKKYYFTSHAAKRKKEREISDLTVLNILKGLPKYNRKRNKKKDKFDLQYNDWNYCIEGLDILAEKTVRIIISFTEELDLLVITVMYSTKPE